MIYHLKTELGKTFLIAGIDFCIRDDYRIRMLSENTVKGLIPLSIRYIDGEKRAYCDVTDKTCFTRLAAHKDLDYSEIRLLAGSLLKVCENLGEYLLDESDLILEPDMIFKNNRTGEYEFICLPSDNRYEGETREDVLNLMNELIAHISSEDNDAVKAGYSMYELIASGNVSMASLYETVDDARSVTESFSEDDFTFDDYAPVKEDTTPRNPPAKRHLRIKEGLCVTFAALGSVFIGLWLYLGYFAETI